MNSVFYDQQNRGSVGLKHLSSNFMSILCASARMRILQKMNLMWMNHLPLQEVVMKSHSREHLVDTS
jgi:hypothetical protein